MKPSATQIFRSASPPTCFPLLGSCVFIGFLSWALIPIALCCGFPSGLAQVTVQVATSNPLLRHHPCRDIDLTSRHQLKSLQLSTDVATSLKSSAAFNWSFMMSQHQSLVATSAYVFRGFTDCFWCRDFSPLSRQQLQLNQLHLSKPFIASRRFSCRDLHPLSRHQLLSRHHDAVATSFL